MNAVLILSVWVGGGLGATARYLVGLVAAAFYDTSFPLATLFVNVVGSFVMGILAGGSSLIWVPTPVLKSLWMTGFLGGFTTFSSFSLDISHLVAAGQWGMAGMYFLLSTGLSIGGLFAGLYGTQMLAPWFFPAVIVP
jgi:CrcB protein